MTAEPNRMTGAEQTYTVPEAAAILRLNPQTVYRFIAAGRINARQIGPRRYRITQSDLDEFLSRNTTDREDEQ